MPFWMWTDKGHNSIHFEVALGYRDGIKGPWKRKAMGNATRLLDCRNKGESQVSCKIQRHNGRDMNLSFCGTILLSAMHISNYTSGQQLSAKFWLSSSYISLAFVFLVFFSLFLYTTLPL